MLKMMTGFTKQMSIFRGDVKSVVTIFNSATGGDKLQLRLEDMTKVWSNGFVRSIREKRPAVVTSKRQSSAV